MFFVTLIVLLDADFELAIYANMGALARKWVLANKFDQNGYQAEMVSLYDVIVEHEDYKELTLDAFKFVTKPKPPPKAKVDTERLLKAHFTSFGPPPARKKAPAPRQSEDDDDIFSNDNAPTRPTSTPASNLGMSQLDGARDAPEDFGFWSQGRMVNQNFLTRTYNDFDEEDEDESQTIRNSSPCPPPASRHL